MFIGVPLRGLVSVPLFFCLRNPRVDSSAYSKGSVKSLSSYRKTTEHLKIRNFYLLNLRILFPDSVEYIKFF